MGLGGALASLIGGGGQEAKISRRQRRASIAGEAQEKERAATKEKERLKGKAGRLALIKTSPSGVLGDSSTGRGKLLGN